MVERMGNSIRQTGASVPAVPPSKLCDPGHVTQTLFVSSSSTRKYGKR